MNEFQLIHNYRRYVHRGVFADITCPDDDISLIVRIGEGETPILWCPACDTITIPGLAFYAKIKALLSEWMDVN